MKQQTVISTHLSPEYVLLGFLALRPSHGYEIHQSIRNQLRHVWRLSLSQVYNVLSRLESQGFVEGELKPQEKRPDRTLFHITSKGRERFEAWLNTPIGPSVRATRMAFISKLYFSSQLADGGTDRRIQAQEAEIRRGLIRLREQLDAFQQAGTFSRLSLQLRISQLECLLRWLGDCRSSLDISS
jgi:DNA-binding PadR family transcriptional regulator